MSVRILFIDDEEMILRALRRSLAHEGFELYFTSDPLDAVKLVGQHGIDIVVSDHMMPQMTGVEVLALIRRLHGHTMRMMMTGQADRTATIKAINEGNICRYIEKPWSDEELKRILHEAERTVNVRRANASTAPDIAAAARGFRKSIVRDADGAIILPTV